MANPSRVEEVLRNKLLAWANDHIFSDDYSLRVMKLSIKDIEISEHDFYLISESICIGILQEENCNWGKFVFGCRSALCPMDKSFFTIIEKVKKSLFSDVFRLDPTFVSFNNQKKFLSKIDAYFCIEVSGAAFGAFKLIVHQSHFVGFIEKRKHSRIVERLSPRLSAISSLKVTANVRFSFGSIPFNELIQLNADRVLSSPNNVKNQFIMSIGNVALCNVAVGKRADRKAFLILKEQ